MSDRAELLDVDPNSGRRKRRKTDENKVRIEEIEDQTESAGTAPKHDPGPKKRVATPKKVFNLGLPPAIHPQDNGNGELKSLQNVAGTAGDGQSTYQASTFAGSEPREFSSEANSTETAQHLSTAEGSTRNLTAPNEVKPKKILRLNPKTGTIGSPPAKKPLPGAGSLIAKRTSNSRQKMQTNVIIIRYSHGKGIGQKIDQITDGTKPVISSTSKIPSDTQKSAMPNKPLHPLFSGKATLKQRTTPHKTAYHNVIDLTRAKEPPRPQSKGRSSPTKPATVAFSGFGAAKLMKFPGAIEPAWPWKDMVHIRGIDPMAALMSSASTNLSITSKKFKYQAIEVSPAESVIGTLTNDLNIQSVAKEIREINPDEYPAVPRCLRLPLKTHAAGLYIQKRVSKELHARPFSLNSSSQSSSEDDLQGTTRKSRDPSSHHAALSNLYVSVAKSFSAFDFGQCETQSWTQKYAPKTADEVLQKGAEAGMLKTWLQKSTVQAVEGGLGGSKLSKPQNVSKRKRKSKEIDDFVVSTEDEGDDMDEITEPEDAASIAGKFGMTKKTVIRAGDAAALASKEPCKLTNAILLSGPHGCGKTAAVYAVAKELGFEVFEINSSSRRSGRDIIERVGDMTRNHQVQRSSNVHSENATDDETQRINDALAKDLKSGRQGTMNSFFKPKQETKPKPKGKPEPKTKIETKKSAETQKTLISKPLAKQQKQSLILFEEVDVIYKEDAQFWATIFSLILTSKRPIIMTCNDESVLPIASLTLHGILRFNPAPVDLAVDYMLLVAASEGHILRREAVKSLYEGRKSDLRASLTELNFWCQFAVGDVKRGLGWYYPRWSGAENTDKKGATIRVISEGTYEPGMGWLSQDFLDSDIDYLDIEKEMLHEIYDGWHTDTYDGSKNDVSMEYWAKNIQAQSNDKKDGNAALEIYAEFVEAMSSTDLCSGGVFAPDNQVRFILANPFQMLTPNLIDQT